MNLEIYQPTIHCETKSIISGEHEEKLPHTNEIFDLPILREFLKDDDLQQVTVVSTCIGFIRTFSKEYKKTVNA